MELLNNRRIPQGVLLFVRTQVTKNYDILIERRMIDMKKIKQFGCIAIAIIAGVTAFADSMKETKRDQEIDEMKERLDKLENK